MAIGVHPHQASEFSGDPRRAAVTTRDQLARTPSAVAVGEIGLDYHYDFPPPSVQQSVFREQVRLARELRLPVVIHTREADQDTLAILEDEGRGEVRGVFHCFTGNQALARGALDLGFHLSVAGIITFLKAEELRETLKAVPLDRLLTETDSPFLAPAPHRGRRNEPAYVACVVARLAELRGLPPATVAEQTTENFHRLFGPHHVPRI
jgi:TatD DNase family protein